jgi:hypothetical protein
MQLAGITKARALAVIELDELSLGGKVRFADCVSPIAERYKFLTFPQKAEDFDLEKKGAKFESGKDGDLAIDSLVIYSGALYVDTFSSTAESQRILEEMLAWGAGALGLTYRPGMIKKWGYISDIVFYSDIPILVHMSPPVQRLAEKVSGVTEGLWNGLKYEPINLSIGHDPTARKNAIASLFIQHRVNSAFSENKYFSEAPVPTDLHIKFLEEFEADILRSLKS